jgi:hypothetical protein
VPGACPTEISITSKNSAFIISPFTIGPGAHQCVLSPGSSGSSLTFRIGPLAGPVGVEPTTLPI